MSIRTKFHTVIYALIAVAVVQLGLLLGRPLGLLRDWPWVVTLAPAIILGAIAILAILFLASLALLVEALVGPQAPAPVFLPDQAPDHG